MPEHKAEHSHMEQGGYEQMMHHMMNNPSHMMHNPQHMMHHEHLVRTIQDCEATCEHMTTHLKHKHDVHERIIQLQLLRDCADICGLTAKYIARSSVFAKGAANLCAYICEMCGRECAKFPDMESQNCARVCLHCAQQCRMFAMM